MGGEHQRDGGVEVSLDEDGGGGGQGEGDGIERPEREAELIDVHIKNLTVRYPVGNL